MILRKSSVLFFFSFALLVSEWILYVSLCVIDSWNRPVSQSHVQNYLTCSSENPKHTFPSLSLSLLLIMYYINFLFCFFSWWIILTQWKNLISLLLIGRNWDSHARRVTFSVFENDQSETPVNFRWGGLGVKLRNGNRTYSSRISSKTKPTPLTTSRVRLNETRRREKTSSERQQKQQKPPRPNRLTQRWIFLPLSKVPHQPFTRWTRRGPPKETSTESD